MIEAFEIGVSLALQDGVSDSISQAQRDLASLEKALSACGVSIQSLREVGLRTASIPLVEPRERLPTSPVSKNASETRLAEPAAPSHPLEREDLRRDEGGETLEEKASGRPITWVAPMIAETPPIVESPPVVERAAPVPKTVFGGAGSDCAQPWMRDWSEAQAPAEAGALPKGIFMSDTSAVTQPIAPTALPQQDVADDTETPNGTISRGFLDLSVFAGSLDYSTRQPDMEGSQSVAIQPGGWTRQVDDGEQVSGMADMPLAPGSNLEHRNQENAPFPRGEDGTEPARRDAWAPSSKTSPLSLRIGRPAQTERQQSSAPQAPGQDQGRPSGDVYLDGVLVGRWISRFLLKEAERADVGPTGFDAKRGRLLPGVTVGA